MDFVGGDGGYVKTGERWRRRNEVGLCLGSRVLGVEGETWEERQRQKIFGQLRPSVELYPGHGEVEDEWEEAQRRKVFAQIPPSLELYRGGRRLENQRSEEAGRREFKLIGEGAVENQSWVD